MHEITFPADYWTVHQGKHPVINHRVGTTGSNIFFVRPEIRHWLYEHAGSGSLYTGLGALSFDHEGRDGWAWDFDSLSDLVRFKFRDHRVAMLFKLTWTPL